MMGVFAEFERAMIAERVRAGLARARGEGKRLGRPPIAPTLEKRIREALAAPGRPGVRVIAKQLGVDPGTVQRISRPFEEAWSARVAAGAKKTRGGFSLEKDGDRWRARSSPLLAATSQPGQY
jgi:DNA invertase Pin-like site-specific DNA recombinase